MTTVQAHIAEKFEKFANNRGISLLGEPTMYSVVILSSSNKGKTQHMAAPAEKGCVPGFLINIGDKKLQFFPDREVLCKPVKNGTVVKNKALLHTGPNGLVFSSAL